MTPLIERTGMITTAHDTYHVCTFLLAPFWHYASVIRSDGTFIPGLNRRRCYGASAVLARLGALGEIERFERRICDFGDGRAA